MSQLEDLIARLSPNGVVFKTLGDTGSFIRGHGLQKKDFTDAGVGCIHYGQIHTHYGTWAAKTIAFVSPALATRLRHARTGDLVIATTSEDNAAVGKAVAWLGTDDVAVSSDAYIYRHSLEPKYVSYFFQSDQFQTQKQRHVTGTKVRRISGESLAKIRLPVPPLEVQREIVRMLDSFIQLEAEVEAELEARRRQYDYYRGALLIFGQHSVSKQTVRWTTLREIAEIGTGSSNTDEELAEGAYPFFVRSQTVRWKNTYEFDETAVITSGDGNVGKVFHYIEGKYALHQRAYRIRIHSPDVVPKFFYHYMVATFGSFMQTHSVNSSVTSVRKPMLERFPVPVPLREDQERIVAILDKFDALANDPSIGLPAELRARRRQYEYYRDRLLTFREAA